MSTFTPSKVLELVANGADVGTWDVPENNNWTIVDRGFGQTTTLVLAAANVILTDTQAQCAFINLGGLLTANVAITFPAQRGSFYTVQNNTAGAFTVTLQTTLAGGEAIGCPPTEAFDILTDGTNIRFRNFGRVGEYMDYGGSSVPAWLSACTKPPYLLCDGSTYSTTMYPYLPNILGSGTLPDARGRVRFALNGGTGRITTAGGGIDGNTIRSGGGQQVMTMVRTDLPNVTMTSCGTLTSAGQQPLTVTTVSAGTPFPAGAGGGAIYLTSAYAAFDTVSVTGSLNGGVAQTTPSVLSPGFVGGLTFIRAG